MEGEGAQQPAGDAQQDHPLQPPQQQQAKQTLAQMEEEAGEWWRSDGSESEDEQAEQGQQQEGQAPQDELFDPDAGWRPGRGWHAGRCRLRGALPRPPTRLLSPLPPRRRRRRGPGVGAQAAQGALHGRHPQLPLLLHHRLH
jgi:hypothetical protein